MLVAIACVTIAMAVSAHNILHLPPVLGMMTGLGYAASIYVHFLVNSNAFG
jgi:hypothetical protein